MGRMLLPRSRDTVPERRQQPPTTSKLTSTACDRCRRTKQKCTGERPTCAACLRRGHECVYQTTFTQARARTVEHQYHGLQEKYDQLQASHETLLNLVKSLQSNDDDRANAIARLLQRGVSPNSIDRRVETGDALMELHVSPKTWYCFQFPFRQQMPSEILRLKSPYLQSLLYEMLESTKMAEAET